MKTFKVILILVILIALVVGGFYFFNNNPFDLGGDVSGEDVEGENGEALEHQGVEDYDNFPLRTFIELEYNVDELGEPDMVFEYEEDVIEEIDGVLTITDQVATKYIHVFGVNPGQENRLEKTTTLDFKIARYQSIDENNPYGNCQHMETRRVMLQIANGLPKCYRVATAEPIRKLDLIVRDALGNNPNITGSELDSKIEQFILSFPSVEEGFEKAFEIVQFKTVRVGLTNYSGEWDLIEKDGKWIDGEFMGAVYEGQLDNVFHEYLRAVSQWDGLSDVIILHNPGLQFNNRCLIRPAIEFIYDIQFNPEFPDFLFESPK